MSSLSSFPSSHGDVASPFPKVRRWSLQQREMHVGIQQNTAAVGPFPSTDGGNKKISIILHGKEVDSFCSFQAIHHFWEREQEHLSNDTLDSLLRTLTYKALGNMFGGHYYLERNQRNCLPSLFFHKHIP